MSQRIKAVIEPNGSIHLLERLRVRHAVEVEVTLPDEVIVERGADAPSPTATDEIRARRAEWLKANRGSLGGQYVALSGDEFVASGRTLREAREAARAAGKQDAFITYLPKPDEVAEMGGWP